MEELNLKREDDILEETLAIAERDYPEAYRYLLNAYEKSPKSFGPQALYFLACLAGGADMREHSLAWLRSAIMNQGWWYRPEVLEDDDLELLKSDPEFIMLKSLSDARYADAVLQARPIFSWTEKIADNLFLAVHGNTQNSAAAQKDWQPVLEGNGSWQLETVQSAEPDGYGTYRWSYDTSSYLPVAKAMENVQNQGYRKIVCGGFSAGCDMLLRSVLFTSANCDVLVLQSPWIPVLQAYETDLVHTIREKNIALRIFCGAEDADCLPMAKRLYTLTKQEGLDVKLVIQENCRHQFPAEPYPLKELL